MLVASDIFGISAPFLTMLKDMDIADKVVIVSPYSQPQKHLENEEQAYECFQKHGGIDTYISRIADTLSANTSIDQAVGFSAGGAALYYVLSEQRLTNIELTLFYPGQIRHFLDQHPLTCCRIIFPESEPHFILEDVINELKALKGFPLTIEQNRYQHGFMNRASTGFDDTAYKHYCLMLNLLIVKS